MAVELSRRLFSIDEYHRMIDAGVLGPDDRLELLEGEIVEMSPIGSRHAACVKKLNTLLGNSLAGRAVIGVQDPVAIGGFSELQPDISVLRLREDFYASAHPGPDDILLIIEVSDTSLDYDRRIKVPLYAMAGIPEVWLIDLEQGAVHVYKNATQGGFASVEIRQSNDRIVSGVLHDVPVRVTDMLP